MTTEMELRKRRRGDLIKFIDMHNIKGFRTKTKPQLIKMIMEKRDSFDFSKLPPVAKDRRAEEKAEAKAKAERAAAREKRRIATRPARQAKKATRAKKSKVMSELKEKYGKK